MKFSNTLLKETAKRVQLEKILKKRTENVHPSVVKNTHFKNAVIATRAEKQWIYDDHAGKKYLDFFGGIVTVGVGHCHPKVNDALFQQAKKIWHTTSIYVTEPLSEYAEKLVSTLPGDLNVMYPVNSGSEANDLAFLMARVATGNFDIISLRNSYHGMSPITMGLTGLSNWKQHTPFAGFHHTMCPNPYKGVWGGKHCRDSAVQTDRQCDCAAGHCNATDKYVNQLEELLAYTIPQKKVAGLFVESIQGVGGVVQFTNGYVKKAFDLVRQNGGLCISDEVQTGFGRTGDHMWHFEAHGVVPDIVTMAKSIGNGFPLAAVVTTQEIANKVTASHHFNTFGGNPLASAVGIAVLEVIEEEKLQANCKEVGTYILLELKKFRDSFEFVGDVRGKGLMLGMEMVENKQTKEPLRAETMTEIFEGFKDEGLLVGKGGYAGNVFRIAPPMCITKQDADMALNIMQRVLTKYAKKK